MAGIKQNKIKKVFTYSFGQENEEGVLEALFFIDESGRTFSTHFNQELDYSEGIEIEVDEYLYRTSQSIGLRDVSSARVIASNLDLISKETEEKVVEPVLQVLFKRNGEVNFTDYQTKKTIHRIRFTDAHGNNSYLASEDIIRIFGTEIITDFAVLGFTKTDFDEDFKKTRVSYPNGVFTNIRPNSIRAGKFLDPNEYDFMILQEIYYGQKFNDERYEGMFFDIYSSIIEERKEATAEVKTKDQIDPSKRENWKRGAEKREAQRQQVKVELAEALRRIEELEALLAGEKQEKEQLQIEISKVQHDYKRLRSILDGEDDKLFASIHIVS